MRTRAQGFTLLELLVAGALLTIAMVGILQIVAGGMNVTRSAEGRTLAVELAEQKLAELTLNPELEPGTDDGDFGDEFPTYRWRTEVTETDSEGLYHLLSTVSWSAGSSEYAVEVETCYAPGLLTEGELSAGGDGGGGGGGAGGEAEEEPATDQSPAFDAGFETGAAAALEGGR